MVPNRCWTFSYEFNISTSCNFLFCSDWESSTTEMPWSSVTTTTPGCALRGAFGCRSWTLRPAWLRATATSGWRRDTGALVIIQICSLRDFTELSTTRPKSNCRHAVRWFLDVRFHTDTPSRSPSAAPSWCFPLKQTHPQNSDQTHNGFQWRGGEMLDYRHTDATMRTNFKSPFWALTPFVRSRNLRRCKHFAEAFLPVHLHI